MRPVDLGHRTIIEICFHTFLTSEGTQDAILVYFRNGIRISNHEIAIKELNDKIEYLQLTPAKRKKIDEANKPKEMAPEMPVSQSSEDNIKDGGSF